ncbi:hypothetical protein RM530_01795 [Algiphilus sp. W345]|uniref:Alpha/beta hydrolase n=1 Tax=Banduia mediterranea TaxID=3075609 RepID=A0ABU2WDZ8_9GAMM|nr:hypothetical protein [Algiphilus sp. W345]MDT0496100.1 hypothetical protein [Algiphilus sp. W345]
MCANALLALGLAGRGLGCAAGLPNSSVEAATAAGIPAQLVAVPQSGHFELLVPGSVAWPAVREAIAAAFRSSAAR